MSQANIKATELLSSLKIEAKPKAESGLDYEKARMFEDLDALIDKRASIDPAKIPQMKMQAKGFDMIADFLEKAAKKFKKENTSLSEPEKKKFGDFKVKLEKLGVPAQFVDLLKTVAHSPEAMEEVAKVFRKEADKLRSDAEFIHKQVHSYDSRIKNLEERISKRVGGKANLDQETIRDKNLRGKLMAHAMRENAEVEYKNMLIERQQGETIST